MLPEQLSEYSNKQRYSLDNWEIGLRLLEGAADFSVVFRAHTASCSNR
jgi:hypothetical protein